MRFIILAILFVSSSAMATTIPTPTAPVMDIAGALTETGKAQLNNKLYALNKEGRVQMGVLIVDSLEGEAIEEFSIKVADQWKLGTKTVDQGLVLILSLKDHKSRIEVGRGLEGDITDLFSHRVLEAMKPYLRSTDYAGAISYAIESVAKQIPDDATREQNRLRAIEQEKENAEKLHDFLIFLGLVVSVILIAVGFLSLKNRKIFLAQSKEEDEIFKKNVELKNNVNEAIRKMQITPQQQKLYDAKQEEKSLQRQLEQVQSELEQMKQVVEQ